LAYQTKELREGFTLRDGLTRTIVIRPFRISGLPIGLGTDDAQIFQPPFPQKGDPDKLFPNAICSSRDILAIRRIDGTDPEGNTGTIVYAAAVFRSDNAFTGGPVPISALSVNGDAKVDIPIFEVVVQNGADVAYVERKLQALRPEATRVETRFVSGIPIADIQDAILSAVGCLFDLDNNGKLVQFVGGQASTTGAGITVVRYQFKTNASVRAIPIGTFQGSDVAIPELPPLFEYKVSTGPVVTVIPHPDLYFFCENTVLPDLI
jgi:hypothetical protein